jgi:hypothetical protein
MCASGNQAGATEMPPYALRLMLMLTDSISLSFPILLSACSSQHYDCVPHCTTCIMYMSTYEGEYENTIIVSMQLPEAADRQGMNSGIQSCDGILQLNGRTKPSNFSIRKHVSHNSTSTTAIALLLLLLLPRS